METTEERILNAALKVFASDGYSGATTHKIANEANVAEVTLFRKFQSKENLLKEVLIQNQAKISATNNLFEIIKNVDLETDIYTLGKKVSMAMRRQKKSRKYRMFIIMLLEEGRKKPEVAEILLSIFQTYISNLSEYFEMQIKNGKMRNINTQSAAITFISYFIYTSLLTEIFGGYVWGDEKKNFEGFIDIFTKGIIQVANTKTSVMEV